MPAIVADAGYATFINGLRCRPEDLARMQASEEFRAIGAQYAGQ